MEYSLEDEQSDMRVDQFSRAIHEVHRDSHNHWRQHAGGENKEQPVRLARHFKARKSVGGCCSHCHGQKSARHCDDQAVGEAANITGALDVSLIVSNKALASVHDDLFPPRRPGILLFVWRTSPFYPCREEFNESSDLRLEKDG